MTEERRQHVFVLGLTDFQRGELETITNARSIAFHQLLPYEVVGHPEEYGFAELLTRAQEQLDASDGPIDAIIAHWDFPTSVLAPILCHERGIPAAPLEAVVACEHKYWSRREQAASVPEAVPAFVNFDPFADDALSTIGLDHPFWIKPVKSHSSQLGFRIENAAQFHEAIPVIRDGIATWGDPFNEVLAMLALPQGISPASGNTCLAEQAVTGRQGAVEGTMWRGEFGAHGVVEMPRDDHGRHFSRYEYPASLPEHVQRQMIATCERHLRHIGYDDGCWNVEFLWDEDADQLWLIEVNTRISQSHSDLFAKVDGMSNHEVAVDVALGSRPTMPDRRGNFAMAAKCFLWTDEVADGIVRRVPSPQEIDRVAEAFPGTHVELAVDVGDRLCDLRGQSAYRFDLASVHLGAQSHAELVERHEACRRMLPFEVEPVSG